LILTIIAFAGSTIAWLSFLFGIVLVACAILEAIEIVELVAWQLSNGRAVALVNNAPRATARPFVSFHVPICSEPPDVVAATLLALRDLDYDAFEVLVVDNNTEDEQLWRPVEQLCHELGQRFRFFHLPVWPGFKAGALNFALKNTDPRASLIGVIDSDYEIAPNYLTEVIGYFEDEKIAFVQTPQDYRNGSLGRFFLMCYWEYWQVFAVSMVLRNRRNAILMHGTMSLVRRQALQRGDRWAEWCLTEDSELGLRILADGCGSAYVAKTYGRGLIPFSFHDYKRQRRRWVIGGVQQLKRHLRLFLPAAKGLTLGQKLHYLQGWLPWLRNGIVVASVPFALLVAIAIVLGLAPPDALAWLGLGMICVLLQFLLRQAVIYRLYLSLPWRDVLDASIAGCSLSWAIGCGWLAGASKADQLFQRTPKRPQKLSGWLATAQDELIVGGLTMLMGFVVVINFGFSGASTVACLWCYAALFLPAVWVAHMSARENGATG
jgi:cellulose synthase/poly-beta-1,6-N-acetylglucosamine synthase-like glycosyltransferase